MHDVTVKLQRPSQNRCFDQNVGNLLVRNLNHMHVIVCNFLQKSGSLLVRMFYGPELAGLGFGGSLYDDYKCCGMRTHLSCIVILRQCLKSLVHV
jgi:hypothetical protein